MDIQKIYDCRFTIPVSDSMSTTPAEPINLTGVCSNDMLGRKFMELLLHYIAIARHLLVLPIVHHPLENQCAWQLNHIQYGQPAHLHQSCLRPGQQPSQPFSSDHLPSPDKQKSHCQFVSRLSCGLTATYHFVTNSSRPVPLRACRKVFSETPAIRFLPAPCARASNVRRCRDFPRRPNDSACAKSC
jgi:hypothetical protein